ncbi:MAG: M20 family metallopeptidase [Clostridiaceae bacterium]
MSLKELRSVIIEEVEKNKEKYINISHSIHEKPEIGNEEFFASKILTSKLEEEGFQVERNIAGHATAFIARKKNRYKNGPVIGYLAEYDALPGLGHACGHNIIGAASVAAAISLGKVLDKTGGEVVVFGTPAEEGGENGSAKGSFVRENIFHGTDVCMMIHPSNETSPSSTSLAVDPLDFEFIGKPAHAAACPEKGINALDAIIQLFNGINALRQHVTSDVRIHGIITHGGDMPNIVPEYAKARFYIRAATRKKCDQVTNRVKDIARGASFATGAKLNIISFQNPVDNLIRNEALDDIFIDNVRYLGEEIRTDIVKGIGSTDAGNVSHVIPTIHPYIKIGESTLVSHTKEFCEAAISKKGDKGLILGAKVLALTGLTLLIETDRLNKIKEEFNNQKSCEI